MKRIVTSTYRYKRPSRRKKAVALSVPRIVATSRKQGRKVAAPQETAPEVKSAIVTTTSRTRHRGPA
jgi:hypothetical protein